MLCVECASPVEHVYREFSKGNIRLTNVCGSFADKYVEYELILVALDLLLLKVQVYRHCLFNLSVAGLKRAMFKLLPAYLCLDVYLYWLRLSTIYSPGHMDAETQKAVQSSVQAWTAATAAAVAGAGIGSWQWPYERHGDIILLQAAGLAIYWAAILIVAWACGATQPRPAQARSPIAAPIPAHAADQPPLLEVSSALSSDDAGPVSPTPLILSLLLSSFGKFFALLPLIWSEEYASLLHLAALAIDAFVVASNLRALRVALGLSLVKAGAIVAVGVLARVALNVAWRSVDPLLIPTAMF